VFLTLLVVFVAIVALCLVVAVRGARRSKQLRGLEDPLAPRTPTDADQEIRTANAKAARPDGATGFSGGPGA
jgi:multisubunit Na+/H+ antiporter MnhC subunit